MRTKIPAVVFAAVLAVGMTACGDDEPALDAPEDGVDNGVEEMEDDQFDVEDELDDDEDDDGAEG